MNKNFKKAFTLIELLVVIAIIGILSAIVIVNLNSARNKAQDTAIKAQATQLKNTAVVYYDDHNYGYSISAFADPVSSATCDASDMADTFFADAETVAAIAGITRNAGRRPGCTVGAGDPSSQSWVLTSKQRNNNKFWCVDSSGASREVATEEIPADGSGNVTCPTE